ncbi:MAG: hypothetical protein U9Q99_00710 [Nanoarchaeota archaeon]|nr:hypothetical protein [Nanoarchaeota archaeon]
MTLKFYTTDPINSEDKLGFSQEYIKTFLDIKFPDNKLIISTSKNIGEILYENYLQNNKIIKKEIIKFENSKKILINQFGKDIKKIRDSQKLSGKIMTYKVDSISSRIKILFKNETEAYQKCLNLWVQGPTNNDIENYQKVLMKTNMAGIIIPFGFGDWKNFDNILNGIEGDFKNNLENRISNVNGKTITQKIQKEYFNEIFQVPIFDSLTFILNQEHNFKNEEDIVKQKLKISWKEQEYHLKQAYSLWLKQFN